MTSASDIRAPSGDMGRATASSIDMTTPANGRRAIVVWKKRLMPVHVLLQSLALELQQARGVAS